MTERAIARPRVRESAYAPGLPRKRGAAVLMLASAPMVLFLLLPLVALVLRVSPAHMLENLASPQVAQALGLSITTTAAATVLTVLAGLPTAFLLARHEFPGRGLVSTLLDLPLVLPPAVAGIALLITFGRAGIVGQHLSQAGIQLTFTPVAVVLAQVFVASPFFVKSAVSGLLAVDREVEQSASVDGASPLQVARMITLPLCWPTLLGGAVMTWARALGEFGATIIFAGNMPGRTQTMPLAIYIGFEMNLNVALTLAAILLGASFVVLLLVKGVLQLRIRDLDSRLA